MAKLVYSRTRAALEVIGVNTTDKIRLHLGSENIDASGKTSQSIKHTVFEKGNIIGVGISSRKSGGYQVLEIIDKGRGVGLPPPYRSIAKWIRDKGIPIKGKQTASNIKRTAIAIAYAIGTGTSRNSLGSFGIRPKNVFDKALNAYRPVVEQQLLDALGADLDQFIDENMPKKT